MAELPEAELVVEWMDNRWKDVLASDFVGVSFDWNHRPRTVSTSLCTNRIERILIQSFSPVFLPFFVFLVQLTSILGLRAVTQSSSCCLGPVLSPKAEMAGMFNRSDCLHAMSRVVFPKGVSADPAPKLRS